MKRTEPRPFPSARAPRAPLRRPRVVREAEVVVRRQHEDFAAVDADARAGRLSRTRSVLYVPAASAPRPPRHTSRRGSCPCGRLPQGKKGGPRGPPERRRPARAGSSRLLLLDPRGDELHRHRDVRRSDGCIRAAAIVAVTWTCRALSGSRRSSSGPSPRPRARRSSRCRSASPWAESTARRRRT